jgi:hypothetical protein
MPTRLAPFCLMALVAGLVGACTLPRPSASSALENEQAKTVAALTVQALGTQLAGGTIPAPSSAITMTPTSMAPIESPQAAGPTIPVITQPPAPAATPAPTTNPAPAASPTALPSQVACDRVKLDGETVPDGTAMTPGQTFTKTWTLKNDGSCTWTASYSLVFISGDALDGPAVQPVTTAQVAPGQAVQVSLELHAPSTPGTFHGNFKLRNGSGVVFGLGPAADQNFWVEIKVASTPTP